MIEAGAPGRVLVVGDVMTDIICRPEGPLVPGSDRRAAISAKPGGQGANQAAWLAAFGLDVRFAARVGAADGTALTAHFATLGVEAVLAGDAARPSGMLVTIVDPDGERSFLTDRGANAALATGDVPQTLLDDVQLLLVSGYALFEPGPRQAVTALFAAAAQRRVPVAVDPASAGFLQQVGTANFLAWTGGAATIFSNAAEAEALTGATDPAGQIAGLARYYPRVVLKRGAAGAALGDRFGVTLSLPAPAVEVVDTTGAGDAFAAAFIAAELGRAPPADCLRRAIAAGSDAVQHLGGRPTLRTAASAGAARHH